MDKKNIIAGNWKMNKTHTEAKEFINQLKPKIQDARALVYIAVPFTSLQSSVEAAENTNITIGAQNMHDKESGAFTGEISSSMLKALNTEFVIIGHSERRHVFNEDDNFINRKVIKALKEKLITILCIGETQEQRDENKTHEVLESQLAKGLKDISKESMKNVVIAYEPVWAIGTGKTATPEIAEKAHCFIRKLLLKYYDKTISEETHILYGGSVKESNVEVLMNQENIDGALIGGASLEVETFSNIINKA